MIDEGLCAVTGDSCEGGLEVGVVDGERVWVGGEEEAEVEGVGGGFLDCDGEFFGGCCGSHGDVSEWVLASVPFLNVCILFCCNDGSEGRERCDQKERFDLVPVL